MAIARAAHVKIVFPVLIVFVSISVPIIKQITPNPPVKNERVPEKAQCDIAPVIKLIPIYLIKVEK